MERNRCGYESATMRFITGSSLIESVTALAVFAVGAACNGTWMMQSMATNARASRLIAATTIVVSLEARMRVNRAGVIAGHYDHRPAVARCLGACDARRRAAGDLRSFHADLMRHIGSSASWNVACGEGSVCTISVAWLDRSIVRWVFRP
jgi:Tfp pilus assembly protein PilV